MKIIVFIIFCSISSNIFYSQNNNKTSELTVEMESWSNYFNETSLDGTFLLKKNNSDTLLVFNSKRSTKSYLPASTFKILNSLIFLETKVIKDENEIIKWDGVKRFYDKWNMDHSLSSAIKVSCVWFYQELARRVGEERIQYYLDTIKYGNSKIGSDVDKFWLEGKLRISAYEQIQFLKKFLNSTLPFSGKNIDIVKNIMIIDSNDNYKLYAKTGWTARIAKQIGWYVGFVENNDQTWIFAMNIDINESEDAKYREELTRKILIHEGIIN